MGKHTQKRSHISAPANTLASRRSCSYLGNCTCLGLCLSWRLGTGFGFGPHRCVASLGWLRRLRHKGPGANKEHQKHSIKKLKHDNIFFVEIDCILKNWLEVLSFKFLAWTSLPTPRKLVALSRLAKIFNGLLLLGLLMKGSIPLSKTWVSGNCCAVSNFSLNEASNLGTPFSNRKQNSKV